MIAALGRGMVERMDGMKAAEGKEQGSSGSTSAFGALTGYMHGCIIRAEPSALWLVSPATEDRKAKWASPGNRSTHGRALPASSPCLYPMQQGLRYDYGSRSLGSTRGS